jgi:hypothetical protein
MKHGVEGSSDRCKVEQSVCEKNIPRVQKDRNHTDDMGKVR